VISHTHTHTRREGDEEHRYHSLIFLLNNKTHSFDIDLMITYKRTITPPSETANQQHSRHTHN